MKQLMFLLVVGCIVAPSPLAALGQMPPPAVKTAAQQEMELKADPDLLASFAYASDVRVDLLFHSRGTYSWEHGVGWRPSVTTWKRWARKAPRGKQPPLNEGSYKKFLEYAAGLAKLGQLGKAKPGPLKAPGKKADDLRKDVVAKFANFAYVNGRSVHTMFQARDQILVTDGGGFIPSYDSWQAWSSRRVPKGSQPKSTEKADYEEFLEFSGALASFRKFKIVTEKTRK